MGVYERPCAGTGRNPPSPRGHARGGHPELDPNHTRHHRLAATLAYAPSPNPDLDRGLDRALDHDLDHDLDSDLDPGFDPVLVRERTSAAPDNADLKPQAQPSSSSAGVNVWLLLTELFIDLLQSFADVDLVGPGRSVSAME